MCFRLSRCGLTARALSPASSNAFPPKNSTWRPLNPAHLLSRLKPGVPDRCSLCRSRPTNRGKPPFPRRLRTARFDEVVVAQIEPDQAVPQWRGGQGRKVSCSRAGVACSPRTRRGDGPILEVNCFPNPRRLLFLRDRQASCGRFFVSSKAIAARGPREFVPRCSDRKLGIPPPRVRASTASSVRLPSAVRLRAALQASEIRDAASEDTRLPSPVRASFRRAGNRPPVRRRGTDAVQSLGARCTFSSRRR